MPMLIPKNVDDYIANFPADIQMILEEVRNTIKNAVPEAEEKISYGMPSYKLKKVLVHFAAQKKHLGFYPTPSGIEQFKNDLAGYDISKGTIRFPWGIPIPFDLIKRIVKFRVEEDQSH
jgi:uncharacterized protein YdhG (YjbR/CyaY superfamily)